MTDASEMKNSRPNDYEAYCMLRELARQITIARDDTDSPTREVAFANIMSALTAMAREILHLDPYSVLGVLEIAKAGVLHGYFEIMTQSKMQNGDK